MPENNQILSVEGQLVGMPLAGPESFSQQQIDYLKSALGLDETVLWEADLTTSVQDRSAGTTFPLTETPANFEILKVYCAKKWPATDANDCGAFCNEIYTAMLSKQNGGVMMLQGFMTANDVVYQLFTKLTGCLTTNITEASGLQTSNGQGGLGSTVYLHPYRIVGIHRISGGNE
jgi:hypothetical protein